MITTIIDGKAGRGKRKKPFIKQVMKDTGIKLYRELKRTINVREKRKRYHLLLINIRIRFDFYAILMEQK